MGLMDEIHAQRRGTGIKCGVKAAAEKLEGDDLTDFQTAIADVSVTGMSIARALQNRGIKLNGEVITRHRRKECSCESR